MTAFTLVTAFLAGAPALKENPPPAGEWNLTRLERDGKAVDMPTATLKCDQGVIRADYGGGTVGVIHVAFRPTTKVNEVDFHPTSPDDMLKGIYKVEADTLTICSNQKVDLTRPTGFASDGDRVIWVFRRVKK
jgi:uncharacterized protein (TIGR03067 family)